MTEYFKIKNGVATREEIPEELAGLDPASLLDLSFTPAELGLQDCAWWPGKDVTPMLQPGMDYNGEINLSLDEANQVVLISRGVQAWSQERLAQLRAMHITGINKAVVAATARPTQFFMEYTRRESQARAYLELIASLPENSRYPAAPELVASFAKSAGMGDLRAAELTVQQADLLYQKQDALANLRMRKYEIERATTAAAVIQLSGEIQTAIRAIAATIT